MKLPVTAKVRESWQLICYNFKRETMRRLKVRTVEQQIKEGKIECSTDIKLGYVEIRKCATGVTETIKVIRNKY
jgi:hypothetical protein